MAQTAPTVSCDVALPARGGRRTRAAGRLGLVVIVLAFGVTAEVAGGASTPGLLVLDLAAGWVLLFGGLHLALTTSRRAHGSLLLAAGILWFGANFVAAPVLAFAHRGPLFHASAGDVRHSPRSPAFALAMLGYGGAWLLDAGFTDPAVSAAIASVVFAAAIASRQIEAVIAAVVYAVPGAIVLFGDATLYDLARALYAFGMMATAGAIVARELRRPGRLDSLVELAAERGVGPALADALRDPTLALLLTVEPERGTVVERRGIALGTIAHRPGVLADPRVRSAAVTAAALELENARLTATLARNVEEAAVAARLLVEAGDTQRRLLERQVEAGPEELLAQTETALALLGQPCEALRRRLVSARGELSDLAAGLHPRALRDGLAPAVERLAREAPLPVVVAVERRPIPDGIATAAYFVCAEALTNVTKHANAAEARIEIRVARGELVVIVTDDGIGGVAPAAPGLSGLADRCAALGGSLTLDSGPGRGTKVIARFPL